MKPEEDRTDYDFALDALPNLHEVLRAFSEQRPVTRVLFAGRPMWLIHSYAEVKKAIGDDEYFSAPEAYKEMNGQVMGDVVSTMTGERHREHRALVAGLFFPKKMRQLAETVFKAEAVKLAKDLKQKKQAELVADYIQPYTFNNITRLLGLPATDSGLLLDWADKIMNVGIDMPAALGAKDAMGAYLEPIVDQRRREPADDVISLLVQSEVEGKPVDNETVYGFCRNLFPAAIDTSANTLATSLALLLENPDLQAYVLDPDKIESFVQEVLRWEPPLVSLPRKCVKQAHIGDTVIQPGEDVRLCITAANNDENVFDNPRAFMPNRKESNLSFGHGEHFCLGSHMARRVVETGLEVLFSHFPHMKKVTDEKIQIVGSMLRAPKAIHVQL